MIEFTFDYHEAHPDFIRLVSIENIHDGRYLAQSETIRSLNSAVTDALSAILWRGRQDGTFRTDIDAVDVHMLISAFCFFRVANRHTFGTLFRRDLSDPAVRKRHKELIADAVLRSLERPRGEGGGTVNRRAGARRPSRKAGEANASSHLRRNEPDAS